MFPPLLQVDLVCWSSHKCHRTSCSCMSHFILWVWSHSSFLSAALPGISVCVALMVFLHYTLMEAAGGRCMVILALVKYQWKQIRDRCPVSVGHDRPLMFHAAHADMMWLDVRLSGLKWGWDVIACIHHSKIKLPTASIFSDKKTNIKCTVFIVMSYETTDLKWHLTARCTLGNHVLLQKLVCSLFLSLFKHMNSKTELRVRTFRTIFKLPRS